MLWHTVTMTHVSWSHMLIPFSFLALYSCPMYSGIKCVGRQCNTLISRIVIVWGPCKPESLHEIELAGGFLLVLCLHSSFGSFWDVHAYNHTFWLIIDISCLNTAYAGPAPDSYNSRTPICGQAKQLHGTLSICTPLLFLLASIHICNHINDIQCPGISSIM